MICAVVIAAQAQTLGCCFKNPTASYVGQVGTRMMVNDSLAYTYVMSREKIYFPNGVTNPKFVLQNYYIDSNNEEVGQNGQSGVFPSETVRASFEYPSGTCTQITWSSQSTLTVSSALSPVSDAASVTVPSGSYGYFREYAVSTGNGTPVNTYTEGGSTNTTFGDAFNADNTSSSAPDQTTSCDTIKNTGGQYGAAILTPAAIVASTTEPAICGVGDSTMQGYPTGQNSAGDMGIAMETIGPLFGYINMGIGGTTAQEYTTNSIVRQSLYQYCSHLISGYGLIDLQSDTASQVEGYLSKIYAQFPRVIFQTDMMPQTTDTVDSCTTTTNQSTQAFESQRVQFNSDLHSNSFGPNGGYFGVDAVVGVGTNNSLWAVSPQAYGLLAAGVCIHPSLYGDAQIQASGAINTSRIAY